jgi:hypothetical protein
VCDHKPKDDFSALLVKASKASFGQFGTNTIRVLSLQQIDEIWGLGSCLYLGTIHGNDKAEAELANELRKRLDKRDRLAKAGDTQAVAFGRAISSADVNYLAAEMLDRAAENNMPLGPELIALIKCQLGTIEVPALIETERLQNMWDANAAANEILAEGKMPSGNCAQIGCRAKHCHAPVQ